MTVVDEQSSCHFPESSQSSLKGIFDQIKSFKPGGKRDLYLILQMIIKDNLPLHFVENERFKHLRQKITPLYRVIQIGIRAPTSFLF
jgi:hypothetical protein